MRAFKLTPTIPLEDTEGKLLIRWVRFQEIKYPELRTFYRIPNEAFKRRVGVKKGMPDYCLPVARGRYNNLFIELKRLDGGIVSADQKETHGILRHYNGCVMIANGWESARDLILQYLNGGIENDRARSID